MSTIDIAAHNLLGLTLMGKWTVIEKVAQKDGGTGGFFSVCYIVENNGYKAFLKALNFNAFFQLSSATTTTKILQEQTNAFEFEKELLYKCKNGRLTKIAMIIDEGEEIVDGFAIPVVPYLIFEIAEGDVRSNIKFTNNLDIAWKAKSLHDVAVGLKQLNSVQISHQDLKPSNVLLYEFSNLSKLADLGRSLCATITAPHDDGRFTGQISYSPPEFLYGYILPEWNTRVKSTDMYLFGSLVAYYFIGINMTALFSKHLDYRFHYTHFSGTFQDVKVYLQDAFSKCLAEISTTLGVSEINKEIIAIIKSCCNPEPEKRGHNLNFFGKTDQYNYERIISSLDLIKRKAELKINAND